VDVARSAIALDHCGGRSDHRVPCAWGLATPAAIMLGRMLPRKRGILIRDAIALEKAGQITAVVFAKLAHYSRQTGSG